MSLRPRITLYVDIVSPFAYEAYYILRNDRAFKECEIEYVPILLGGLMKRCGNTAPIYIKNKDKWIQVERLRWARAFGVPMKDDAPPGFPPRTLTAMRAVSVVASMDKGRNQDRLTRVLDALFHGLWAEHRPVHEPEVLDEVLRSVLGNEEARQGKVTVLMCFSVSLWFASTDNSSAVVSKIVTEGKDILASNTDRAFSDGAFGLPWMICTNAKGQKEGFWGVDHLGLVIQFLGLKRVTEAGWKALL
ncbi:hypothetical protein SEUCBS140593_010695 [Sporothrix eucalyptigena]|uniref:Glutathione S-transferase kappa n=1 Tax=Sporothrix eucalyptigena TaxID=1812306 RepID=A0ABP0D5Q0_9PEZI